MEKFDFAGKTVLVTGGSLGLGECFARELQRRGARLILVARNPEKLKRLARELGNALVIAEDLTRPGAAQRVHAAVLDAGIDVDVLINNAGFGRFGSFEQVALSEHSGQIELNVTALVELTHRFLPMIERRRGGVLQIASTAAFQPVPYMAVYGATKAFVLSFGEALWAEYRGRGVRVTTLCPGAMETDFFKRAGEEAAFGSKARPEDVVRLGLQAFQSGRASVVHGWMNRCVTLLNRFFSRAMTARISAWLMRPRRERPSNAQHA